jgi:uncharacterized protein YndB with AHSA1/START domain
MTVADSATTLVCEIDIKAPVAKIFAAMTDPDQLVKWWGNDEDYRCDTMERDLRVGGTWRTTGPTPTSGAFVVEGTYRTIEPPHLLEYTWNPSWGTPHDAETLVRIELDERDGVTHVRLTHSGFSSLESKAGHEQGWTRVLGWLRDYIE